MRYHMGKDGKVRKCEAQSAESCPLLKSDDIVAHGDSVSETRQAYEMLANGAFSSFSKMSSDSSTFVESDKKDDSLAELEALLASINAGKPQEKPAEREDSDTLIGPRAKVTDSETNDSSVSDEDRVSTFVESEPASGSEIVSANEIENLNSQEIADLEEHDFTVSESSVDDDGNNFTRFMIPSSSIDEAIKRVTALNKRLERAGVEQRFEYVIGEPELVKQSNRILPDGEFHYGRSVVVQSFTVNRPVISHGGYDFVAVLKDGGRNEDGEETDLMVHGLDLPEHLRPKSHKCDHCGIERKRAKTFMMRNKETGEIMQLGSSCVKPFFRGLTPTGLWSLDYELGRDIELALNKSDGSKREHTYYKVDDVLAASYHISDNGENYVTSKMADMPFSTTGHRVRREMEVGGQVPLETLEDLTRNGTVAKLKEEIAELGDDSNYVNNIRSLAKGEWVAAKDVGLLASSLAALRRERERKARLANGSGFSGKFFSSIGEKFSKANLTVSSVRSFEGRDYYGNPATKKVVTFRGPDGEKIVWWASGATEIKSGDKVLATSGRVKKQDYYNDEPQTTVSHLRLRILDDDS